MTMILIPFSVAFPLLLALPLWPKVTRPLALALAPLAPLPALCVAILGEPGSVSIPWLLLGMELGLDSYRRVFLLFTAILWLAAGVYAAGYHRGEAGRPHLTAFQLLTVTGNLGLIVSLDAASFYLFFILMSFAAFGLIVHTGTGEAKRAGLVYLVMVILGEVLILPGLWLSVSHAKSSALTDVAAAAAELGMPVMLLLAAGFGVKAGAVPLHVWLPLAHPAAPTPWSAILSGAMIKAGLLAWVVFLPVGLGDSSGLPVLFAVLGIFAAFYGAAMGVFQERPKTVLAYSSISQMGLMAVGAGAALSGDAAAAGLAAVAVYALHHALAKGALFLGVGVVASAGGAGPRRAALLLLLLPALALAGAPFTSGVIAKTALGSAVSEMDGQLSGVLYTLLPYVAAATTLLMLRFLWLMSQASEDEGKTGLWAPWLALIAAAAILPWLPVAAAPETLAESLTASAAWSALWPMALGAALFALAHRLFHGRAFEVPEGNVMWPVVKAAQAVIRAQPLRALEGLDRAIANLAEQAALPAGKVELLFARIEDYLESWTFFAVALLLAVVGGAVLLL